MNVWHDLLRSLFPDSPSSDQEIRRPPSRTGTSHDNMTSPGNMNIHVNPSQSYGNPMYVNYGPQGLYSGSEKRTQGFYQSGNSAQDFHQSRDSTQTQAQQKALHRVLSCPDCFSLYDEGEGNCPSCSKAAAAKSTAVRFSPNQHALNTAATKLSGSGISNSEQNRTLKELASRKELVGRPLPDPPRGQGVVARDNEMDVDHDVYEDVDNLLEWNCEHCTFANPPSTKVCQACYKTPSDLKNKPKLVQVRYKFVP